MTTWKPVLATVYRYRYYSRSGQKSAMNPQPGMCGNLIFSHSVDAPGITVGGTLNGNLLGPANGRHHGQEDMLEEPLLHVGQDL